MKFILTITAIASVLSFIKASTFHIPPSTSTSQQSNDFEEHQILENKSELLQQYITKFIEPKSNQESTPSHLSSLSQRNLEDSSCSDSTVMPCYNCLKQKDARYCKYTKAFDMYKCCPKSATDGICASEDPDVICSDSFEGSLKYQVCYSDSLSCGSSVIFLVNETLSTQTSQFFNKNSICFYQLQIFENNDMVTMNITFVQVIQAEVYFIYKLVGDTNYTEEKISKSRNELIYRSFNRSQLQDKKLYVVALGNQMYDFGVVQFNYSRTDIPIPDPDYSTLAEISVNVLIVCLAVAGFIKIVESIYYFKSQNEMNYLENREFQSKLGIDFDGDKKKLRILESQVRDRFGTKWLKHSKLSQN